MDLNTILEYQKIDTEVWGYEKKLRDCPSKKAMDSAKDSGNRNMEELKLASKRVEDIVFKVNKFNKEIEALLTEVNDIADTVEEFEELKELDLYEKKINQIVKQIEDYERSVNSLLKDLNDIDKTKDEQIKQVKIAQVELLKNKEKYEQERAAITKEAKPLIEKLRAMEQNIDPKLLTEYKAIRKVKTPVLIAANLENKSCGCGIELDSNVLAALKKQGYAKCPNCMRIMYVKNN